MERKQTSKWLEKLIFLLKFVLCRRALFTWLYFWNVFRRMTLKAFADGKQIFLGWIESRSVKKLFWKGAVEDKEYKILEKHASVLFFANGFLWKCENVWWFLCVLASCGAALFANIINDLGWLGASYWLFFMLCCETDHTKHWSLSYSTKCSSKLVPILRTFLTPYTHVDRLQRHWGKSIGNLQRRRSRNQYNTNTKQASASENIQKNCWQCIKKSCQIFR